MHTLNKLTLEDAAKEAAGNWREFDCFMWRRKLYDAEEWAIIYTHTRDSGLLDQSNASVIDKALAPFLNKDVLVEDHSHWACGWVSGYAIRVYSGGRITKAFQTYYQLAKRLADYPLLDEDDYSDREYDATLENIADAAWQLKTEYDLPVGWENCVYGWFSDYDNSAIENVDDVGGYPSEEQLRKAFDALGYKKR